MFRLNRRRGLVLGAVIVVILALVAGIGYVYLGRRPHPAISQAVDTKGGVAWNPGHTIAVRIAPNGVAAPTTVQFRSPDQAPPESPLADLTDIVVPAVDIVPDHPITQADVVFTLDPAKVPPAPSPGTSTGQRTIANAGIEVFNTVIGAWIPIPTTVENGNQLVAHAPHFSLFRAVWNKLGEFTIQAGQAVKVVLTAATKTIDLIAQTGLALLTTTFDSLLGRFDNSLFDCGKRNKDYRVKVTDDTRQGKLGACVIQPAADHNQLLIKDALAVPFKFSGAGIPGLFPDVTVGDMDLLTVARSLTGTLTGDAYASGLDVTAFTMAKNTPQRFTVKGELSWVSMAVDFTIGLLAAILPASKTAVTEYRAVLTKVQQRLSVEVGRTATRLSYQRITQITQIVIREERITPTVAGQVTTYMDAVNCALGVGQKLAVRNLHDLPAKLADIARACLLSSLKGVGEAKDIVELLKQLASEGKQLPALGQLAGIDLAMIITGREIAKVKFDVAWLDPALRPFLGRWEAHGAYFVFDADGTGTFWNNYGPCLPLDSNSPMCAENWDVTLKSDGDGMWVNLDRIWHSTWGGGPTPKGFVAQYVTNHVGDRFRMNIPDRPDIIKADSSKFATEFCKAKTDASSTGRCGG